MDDKIRKYLEAAEIITRKEINELEFYKFSFDDVIKAYESIREKRNRLSMKIAMQSPEIVYGMNDKGFSALFAEVTKDKHRYNVSAKEWYYFDGKRWNIDSGSMKVLQTTKDFHECLLAYCDTITDNTMRSDYMKEVRRFGQLRYRETLIKDARDLFFIKNSQLDCKKNYLNCKNVTLDLNDFSFYPHKPSDMLTKVCNVSYNPEAKCELWENFLVSIMDGNKEKIEYLQKILGYALTAETDLETCFIFYGSTTRNGKSTLIETIAYMLGDYSVSIMPHSLATKNSGSTRQASGDIARLKGCRFLSMSEPPKNMQIDSAFLKTLLGRDSVTARHLYEREFEFLPEFKLLINTNHLPKVSDDTLFTSGRINVIEFNRHFTQEEQDRTLKQILKRSENLSGILNWCIEGLKKFRNEGAVPPACVVEATREYRKDSDKIINFVTECLKPSEKNCPGKDAYSVYRGWCNENGFDIDNKSVFYSELREKNILSKTGTINGRTTHNVLNRFEIRDNPMYCYEQHRMN